MKWLWLTYLTFLCLSFPPPWTCLRIIPWKMQRSEIAGSKENVDFQYNKSNQNSIQIATYILINFLSTQFENTCFPCPLANTK